jgi:hypothetical protein
MCKYGDDIAWILELGTRDHCTFFTHHCTFFVLFAAQPLKSYTRSVPSRNRKGPPKKGASIEKKCRRAITRTQGENQHRALGQEGGSVRGPLDPRGECVFSVRVCACSRGSGEGGDLGGVPVFFVFCFCWDCTGLLLAGVRTPPCRRSKRLGHKLLLLS